MSKICLTTLYNEQRAQGTAKLIPNLDKDRFLGIPFPTLRDLAKQYKNTADGEEFLNSLPHYYMEENTLHMYMIGLIKDFDEQIAALTKFLPYLDNWASCDGFSSKTFKNNLDRLLPYIYKWLDSELPYTKRFAMLNILKYYIKSEYITELLNAASQIRSENYYVNMMVAWLFATALTDNYDVALPYILNNRLSIWQHNKTIQKARESLKLDKQTKDYLFTLKR